jgi:hypothetical protein
MNNVDFVGDHQQFIFTGEQLKLASVARGEFENRESRFGSVCRFDRCRVTHLERLHFQPIGNSMIGKHRTVFAQKLGTQLAMAAHSNGTVYIAFK